VLFATLSAHLPPIQSVAAVGQVRPRFEALMSDVVNLRVARKRLARARAAEHAAQNRAAHGRSESERRLTEALREKAATDLDHHRNDTGERQ
jgi:hypothetical protein